MVTNTFKIYLINLSFCKLSIKNLKFPRMSVLLKSTVKSNSFC